MQIELLGTLVFITSDKWDEIVEQTDIVEFIHNNLINGFAEDDIVLESLMLIGTVCRSDRTANVIASSYLIKLL